MSANQTAPYTPAPVTQRDGSALANSNCRMASIATGLDYDTEGAKRSTGAKMRGYTSDQSGGTDSGDAREAWDRGYGEVLTVRDGRTFNDALAELVSGHLVHLDVWHASVGGPCLSGTGSYGHTMAVLPDCADGKWLVADPWCSPGKWTRTAEAKLRAGAEQWGAEVYGRALDEPDYPTGGPPPTDYRVLLIVARIVRALMGRYHAGGEELDPQHTPETGGGQPILYTVTRALEVDMADVPVTGTAPNLCDVSEGVQLYELGTMAKRLTMPQDRIGMHSPFSTVSPGGTTMRAVVYSRPDPDPDLMLAVYNADARNLRVDPAYQGGGDGDDDTVRADRDEEWREWLLAGSPGEAP